MKRVPVILDTDIGSDIDDTWALAMMLQSPELDLRLVTTATGDTVYRAKIVAKMMEVAGRIGVPIGIGLRTRYGTPRQGPWVADYDLASYPGHVYEDGVGALVEAIMGADEPLTLVCIGPLPNVAAALEREPRIAQRARFVGMHGSIHWGEGGAPRAEPEYNVASDPLACRKVFSASWPMTITPLDTCGIVVLDGARYQAVRESLNPLARAVIENYRVWAQDKALAERQSSVLYDTVAAYLAFGQELLLMRRLGIRISDESYTVVDPSAKQIDCALEWRDLGAFEDLIVHRVTGA